MCEQSRLTNCNSSNYCIENDDWRPSQELLLTRFDQVEYTDMFRTINQDYGSFYYGNPQRLCIPDVLTEKIRRQQDRFMNWFMAQTFHRLSQSTRERDFFPQCNIETVKITHRKKFSTNHIDEMIIDFLVRQIHQRLENVIDPNDYHVVVNCARVLITELLTKEPSLCAEDVINRVIGIMNTPFYSMNTNSNMGSNDISSITKQNLTNECYPVTPPSSSFLPF